MTLDDLLGRTFHTTDASGTRFRLSGIAPAYQEVRLTPDGRRRSQRVALAVFMAALYSGAIEESEEPMSEQPKTETVRVMARDLQRGDRISAFSRTSTVVGSYRRAALPASKVQVDLADASGVITSRVWGARTVITVERPREA